MNEDAARKRAKRQQAREVVVAKCADPQRRRDLEADDEEWLYWYFGEGCGLSDPYTYRFTGQQQEMIAVIRAALEFGGDQAIAASRGEGKTTNCERILLKYTLQGKVPFAVLLQATGELASNSLDSIKVSLEENDRLKEDYPEVCDPIRALDDTPNRAHYSLVTGTRHDNGEPYKMASAKFKWSGKEIILPRVPGSPAAGSVIATRGLDGAIRGVKRKGRRPWVAVIDDPDTERTAESEEQAAKLEKKIDRAVAGLGTQQRPIARVMITTLMSRKSASYLFTDPKRKPTWRGKRFRSLIQRPERADLWDEYVQMRQAEYEAWAAGQSDDVHCRKSHRFYEENREAMDAGAEMANPHRYDTTVLPDGSQVELSALQRYYNEVARIGPDAVATEYDNDPPEESGPIGDGLTSARIQRQVSGYPRRVVPEGCTVLVQGIDVRKVALHWVVRAWRADATGYTIDYGVTEVHGTKYGSDEGVEIAIKRAILARMEEVAAGPYVRAGGEAVPLDLTLIDSGYKHEAIYAACRDLGAGVYPAKGFGQSEGCAGPVFRTAAKTTHYKKPGDGWVLSRQHGGIWLVDMDADRWKSWEHARWLTAPDKPGSMLLWGEPGGERLSDDQKKHFAYSRHITAEGEVEEVYRGSLRRRFKSRSNNNHWLDASYMANVAANMKGIHLLGEAPRPAQHGQRPELTGAGSAAASASRPTLDQMRRGR